LGKKPDFPKTGKKKPNTGKPGKKPGKKPEFRKKYRKKTNTGISDEKGLKVF